MCDSSSSKSASEINCSSCGDTNVKYKEHVPEEDVTHYWCEECALTLHDNPDDVFEEVSKEPGKGAKGKELSQIGTGNLIIMLFEIFGLRTKTQQNIPIFLRM